ncbi:tryptophan-rich sensory protein [Candidatus Woesearchaeota archaeon]|nr:tryptophan-rich sensory protein [Candidatus Woesearchaeota archaeon]
MKPNYIIIPLVTILVSVIGSYLTSSGMNWYKTIELPSFTPPGSFIGAVWTVIFVLTTISALIVWNNYSGTEKFWWIIGLFMANAILNLLWSLLFFNQHLIFLAIFDAAFLDLIVIALMILIWPLSKLGAGLLLPYAIWAAFATYLNYRIWLLNK